MENLISQTISKDKSNTKEENDKLKATLLEILIHTRQAQASLRDLL